MRVPIYIVLSFILDTLIFKLIDLKTVGERLVSSGVNMAVRTAVTK